MPQSNLRIATLCVALLVAFPVTASAQLGGLLGTDVEVPVVKLDELLKMQKQHREAVKKAEAAGETAPEPSFVLIDVRSEKETAVSVIPGAITAKMFEKDKAKYADRQAIAYCTSGYRSNQFAAKLITRGRSAKNFKASILGWCRARQPLRTLDGKPTRRVHTYSSRNRVPDQYEAVN